MQHANWAERFRDVYNHALDQVRKGASGPKGLVTPDELTFLESIGCSTQELFDFVDDFCQYEGDPGYETTLLITSVRRDYFLFVQKGVRSQRVVSMDSLPPKAADVDGIAWLPRLIVKARVKLRGEMPPDLMYCCAGDRAFARSMNFHPADFLREVWAAGDDDRRVVEWVKRQRDQLST
jgi:hypothetical protein